MFYTASTIKWYEIAFLVCKQCSKADYMERIKAIHYKDLDNELSLNASKPLSVTEIDRTLQRKVNA